MDIQELLSGPQLTKRQLKAKLRNAEVASFDRTGLNVTEGVEKNVLPGHSDVWLERTKIKLIRGIQNFDTESPARGSVKEPNGVTELDRQ